MVSAIVVVAANRAVASVDPSAANSLKKGGKTAVITVDWNAELAQSYIAHARSSGRFRPMRARRRPMSERLPRHPLAQERIDHQVASAFLCQEILFDQRGQRGLNARRATEAEPVPGLRRQQLPAVLQNGGSQDRALGERETLPDGLEHRVLFRQQTAQGRVQAVDRDLSSA